MAFQGGGWLIPWVAPRGRQRHAGRSPWRTVGWFPPVNRPCPTKPYLFFFFKEKKTTKNTTPTRLWPVRIWSYCNELALAQRCPSRVMAPPGMPDHWGLFCLQLLCFISATPHMPPSGFRSGKFLIKHDFQTRRFCQLFRMSQPCYWRSMPRCRALRHTLAPLQTSPATAGLKSRLSSAPATSHSSLHPQRCPQEISTTLGFAYSSLLFAYHVQSVPGAQPPFDCPPYPSVPAP